MWLTGQPLGGIKHELKISDYWSYKYIYLDFTDFT